METLTELIEQRRGYKYLNKDRTSPYQHFKYNLRKKIFRADLDTDKNLECGKGINLATLEWILKDTSVLDKIIVEFSIPPEANIIVPNGSSGKFRTDIVHRKKIHKPEDIFPEIRGLLKRLKKYKPVNPITATKIPDKKRLLKVLKKVGDQVGAQVGDQVWAQVWAQVGDQVGDQAWDQVWAQVREKVGDQAWAQVWAQVREKVGDQVGAQVRDQVRDQVWAQVGAQVRGQVRAQVYIISYFAAKEFLSLGYDHPAFDLIRMGVVVVRINNKFKVFGKNGKHLGDI